MPRLITIWFDICLLHAGPQDLPASRNLLGLTLAAYVLVSFLISASSATPLVGLQIAVLDLLLLAGFAALTLYLLNKLPRLGQTLSALAGTGALLGLIALPVVRAVLQVPQDAQASPVMLLSWFALLLWSLLVTAHIMRHAMSSSLIAGAGVSILYVLVSYAVISTVFPQ